MNFQSFGMINDDEQSRSTSKHIPEQQKKITLWTEIFLLQIEYL